MALLLRVPRRPRFRPSWLQGARTDARPSLARRLIDGWHYGLENVKRSPSYTFLRTMTAPSGGRLSQTALQDVIRVDKLVLMVPFTDGAQWPATQPEVQPVQVSLTIPHDLRRTAETDDLAHSIDYSAVVSLLVRNCVTAVESLESLADRVFELIFNTYPEIDELNVTLVRPKALLHASACGIESQRRNGYPTQQRLFIEDIACQVIVGINPCEREEKQRVLLNISIDKPVGNTALDFRRVTKDVLNSVQASSFLTIEAMASSIAETVLRHAQEDTAQVRVRVSKPSALVLADAAEVEVIRTIKDYAAEPVTAFSHTSPVSSEHPTPQYVSGSRLSSLLSSLPQEPHATIVLPHRAAIALGANLGDRFANIERALRMLEAPGGNLASNSGAPRALVVDTSFMYETAPMYVVDQPPFINCACMIETDMSPRELLAFLKEIESAVGRVTSFRNGPRAIDIDILTYDSEILDTRPEHARSTLDNLDQELVIPHPRIAEREFVLRPLNDLIPDYVHPTLRQPVKTILAKLLAAQPAEAAIMHKVLPFPHYPLPSSSLDISSNQTKALTVPSTSAYWTIPVQYPSSRSQKSKTYIMATLNATPDSFSDGSRHNSISTGVAYASSSTASGADIIDVGGYSTRPHAAYVSPDEEISRVVPIIQAIRSDQGQQSKSADPQLADVLISVDTFRAEVVLAAVQAGANCINDVHAFTGPEYPLTSSSAEHFIRMRSIARDLAVPVILMHSRGEASANKDYSAYSYAADIEGRGSVLEGVRLELGEKVEAAVKGRGGIRRWLVIVDPGIGFSKTVEGNLELLRNASAITSESTCPGVLSIRNPLAGFPQLIGASRKSFLGSILERPHGAQPGRQTKADERGWATAAVVSCAVQQKASIVRVHDVQEMGDVIKVSSELWGR